MQACIPQFYFIFNYQFSIAFGLSVHRHKELLVRVGALHEISDHVHSLDRVHIRDMLTEDPHTVESCLVVEKIITASATLNEVDSREDTLVGK